MPLANAQGRTMMFRCANHYSISGLIYQVLAESGTKRSLFIAGLGYRNIAGGLRSLDRWLQTGTGDPLLIERLVHVHPIDPTIVRRALAETDAQHKAEYDEARRQQERWDREHFRQCVFVETPVGVLQSSFTVAAIVAPSLKFIPVPEGLDTLPEPEQLRIVADVVRRHYTDRQGKLPLFGEIVGYRFVAAYDASIRLDIAGQVIERVAGHFVGPGGAIQIARRTVAPTLLLGIFEGLR
jgi:hypothetical protein